VKLFLTYIFCVLLFALYTLLVTKSLPYSPTPLLPYFLPPLLLFLLLLFALLRHREKATKKKLDLIGKVVIVQTELSPEGAILADGELWLATAQEEKISVGTKVRIIKSNGLRLEVSSIDAQRKQSAVGSNQSAVKNNWQSAIGSRQ
jgi:membrane protein implicated in regulation of membrane protease activity